MLQKNTNACRFLKSSLFCTLLLSVAILGKAQGPEIPYFYNSNTTLSWASAAVTFKSGSAMKVPFFPVVKTSRCPFGTGDYSRDINIEAKVFYVSNLGTYFSTQSRKENVTGKAVLLGYNKSVDTLSLVDAIYHFAKNGAAMVVLYYPNEQYPYKRFFNTVLDSIDIPIVTVSNKSANDILTAAGYDIDELTEKLRNGLYPKAAELICSFRLNVKGVFSTMSSQYSLIRFNRELIDSLVIQGTLKINDDACAFLLGLFKPLNPKLEQQRITYFSDYDEKLFFTSHFGSGLAAANGIYSVLGAIAPSYELAVHELTHKLFSSNWNGNCSFLSEGIAMYAQDMSIESNANNVATYSYLRNNELMPLSKMVNMDIGEDDNTKMGYYASGSFVQFIIEKWGQKAFLELWKTDREWKQIYGKSLTELEQEWHNWLREKV